MKRKARIDYQDHAREMVARKARRDARGAHLKPTEFHGTDFRVRQAQARNRCAMFTIAVPGQNWNRPKRLQILSEIRRLDTLRPLQLRRLGQDFGIKSEIGQPLVKLQVIRDQIRLRFPKTDKVTVPEPWHGFKKWSKARFDRAFPDPEATSTAGS